MENTTRNEIPGDGAVTTPKTALAVLFAISFSHLLNDVLQALIPALYPMMKAVFALNYSQIGWITFTFQCTASIFQPLVGWVADKRTMPRALAVGMSLTLIGLLSLSLATSYPLILISAALIGLGSAIFHPEASRIAYMAAGERRGFAQSLFQVGGNAGSAFGPLMATMIVISRGLGDVAWFSLIALVGVILLWNIGSWQKRNLHLIKRKHSSTAKDGIRFPRKKVIITLGVLVALIFSKHIYLVSLSNYYTFYLIQKFGVSVKTSQILLFVFLFSVAAGTIIGGPVGDRIGRKRVIWASILGVAPFSLLLPHTGLVATVCLTVLIGLIMASAFSAVLVYAQELVPGKVGMIAGLFFGLAFGTAGIGSAALGRLADHTSIEHVFAVCAYFPLIGILTVLLPNLEPERMKK